MPGEAAFGEEESTIAAPSMGKVTGEGGVKVPFRVQWGAQTFILIGLVRMQA
jgi:hypothetical protein